MEVVLLAVILFLLYAAFLAVVLGLSARDIPPPPPKLRRRAQREPDPAHVFEPVVKAEQLVFQPVANDDDYAPGAICTVCTKLIVKCEGH